MNNKSITRDRILATHAKIDAFCDHLTKDDFDVLRIAATHGIKEMAHSAFGIETPQIERDKARLEMNVNGIQSPQAGHQKIDRLFYNMERVNAKRSKVVAVQLAHNISGLQMGEDRIGDGVISLWEPSDNNLELTNDDMDLLRGDRVRLLQFWIDHVLLNNLEVKRYDDASDEFKGSDLDFVRVMSRNYDWVHFFEHKTYLKPDRSRRVRGSDGSEGHVLKSSNTPQEGFAKHHEIHLILGDGKSFDCPDRSVWFCATNGVMPFR
jgi:hypothetical protein